MPVPSKPRTTRIGTTPILSPPMGQLLTFADLFGQYLGAFRVPPKPATTPAGESYLYGGASLAFNPARSSLLLGGFVSAGRVGEIAIPAPVVAPTVAGLTVASTIHPLMDLLLGKRQTVDGGTNNGVYFGSLVPLGGDRYSVNVWTYYDGSPTPQTKTHFLVSDPWTAQHAVTGPFQVGTGFQYLVPTDVTRIGGFVSGYQCAIPTAWQPLLGGTHLTGQGGRISILNRTSSGPSASVFIPSELGTVPPARAVLMGYPQNSSNVNSPLHHPTLGVWGTNTGIYNGTQGFRSMVWPDGTDSILFFGWDAAEFCYGAGTTDPAKHRQPVPNEPGVIYCYDPTDPSKGTHSYPARSICWAYDANDFLKVKEGAIHPTTGQPYQPWDVRPYATWIFTLPFQVRLVNGVDVGYREIYGATFDPATRRLFISAYRQDGNAPLIHVFSIP